jgi:hypothetical protein
MLFSVDLTVFAQRVSAQKILTWVSVVKKMNWEACLMYVTDFVRFTAKQSSGKMGLT